MIHRLKPVILAILVGLFLGFSAPPFHTGFLALVAFIPFFYLFENINGYKKAFLYSYLSIAVFHLIPCYWLPLTRDHYLAVVAIGFGRKKFSADDVEISGLYWHFVDLVWMFIFPLVYLISARLR